MKLGEMEKPTYNNKECDFSNSIYLGILRSVMVMAMAEREREKENGGISSLVLLPPYLAWGNFEGAC